MSFELIRTEVVVGELPITTAQVTIITSAMVTGIFSTLGNCDRDPATKVTEIIGLINKSAAKKIIHEDKMSISAAVIFKCANCCANHSISNTVNNNASVKPIATIAMIFVVNSKFFHSTKVNNSNTGTANMVGGWYPVHSVLQKNND